MTAIAKVVLPPPVLFGMAQWNSYRDWGKTLSMIGMILGLKRFQMIFCLSKVPAIFRESSFYFNSLI
jgi:hypothetical protein